MMQAYFISFAKPGLLLEVWAGDQYLGHVISEHALPAMPFQAEISHSAHGITWPILEK